MDTISRRSLGKGAAWSVPAIIAAGAVPAMAASPGDVQPDLIVEGRVSWNTSWDSSGTDGNKNFKIYSTTPNTVYPGQGYRVENTTPSTIIGPMTITFYLPTSYSRMTFFSGAIGTGGWSTLQRDYSKTSIYEGATAFYAFTTQYSGNLPAESGTTYWPAFSFISESAIQATADHFYVDNHTTIDGKDVDRNYDQVSMTVK